MEVKVRERVKAIIQMRKVALAKLIIPFILVIALILYFVLFVEPEESAKYATIFGIYAFMPLFGLETAIPTGLSLGIPPAALISFILYTDATISFFLVWNFDYAKKIPGIGKVVEKTEEAGEEALRKYKWIKKIGFIGLTLFVIIPFQYTGSVAGSIVGRLIGMPPLMTWLAIIIGCFSRSTLWTFLAIVGIAGIKWHFI